MEWRLAACLALFPLLSFSFFEALLHEHFFPEEEEIDSRPIHPLFPIEGEKKLRGMRACDIFERHACTYMPVPDFLFFLKCSKTVSVHFFSGRIRVGDPLPYSIP